MSTIQVFSRAANQAGRVIRDDKKPPTLRSFDKPEASDQDMMYAWSIGVTTATRPKEGQTAQAECPPEVYIG